MGKEENFKGNTEGTQFGNGQPTDRGGAKKGKRVSTILKELLEGDAKQFSTNKDYKNLDGNTALAFEMIIMGFYKGNATRDKISAINSVWDRTDGKAKQTFDFDASEVLPIITCRSSDIK